jgi:hypothetical protein
MRTNSQYIQKIQDEMTVYQQRLKFGDDIEMTEIQEENWEKINIIWKLLKDGESESEILKMAQNHPGLKVMNRRARELLYMTYEVFADLRLSRNVKAVKMLDSESYREASGLVMTEIKELLEPKEMWDAESGTWIKPKKNYQDITGLFKIWKELKIEAGKIDGVYLPDSKNQDEKKKPKNIIIKKLTVNQNFQQNPQKTEPIDTTYELQTDS